MLEYKQYSCNAKKVNEISLLYLLFRFGDCLEVNNQSSQHPVTHPQPALILCFTKQASNCERCYADQSRVAELMQHQIRYETDRIICLTSSVSASQLPLYSESESIQNVCLFKERQ